MQIFDFAQAEIKDLTAYNDLNYKQYCDDKNLRRLVDRMIENITNAVIDLAKIIISEKNIEMPDSYAGIMEEIARVLKLSDQNKSSLVQVSKLRNILAHEYMEIKFEKIKDFIVKHQETVKLVIKKTADLL
ncbi:hypothetical protein A2291_08230 [candidate division WOR-1 bacterium RIFOXYB2_FULL_42_35]|uniref:DUF86 domain-containing protein n=1 Tax=candidate division WOR-1 bacterium RIFOXYC2_FULL_41_25 TaxID=1802586 RepID=A0A1F4TII1_UNCSA|nr:MAG: hypothetical protein A2247_01915 [candidate division WOR-1 bacterium RIFOXYA2_FULL_41_14]OGC24074.1 MAG: hypothetical protein A2291_08230 [candidate division WOR-1 bacterium RIFOXYB2_FULL_42_35]OGC32496.1 MAG: hypothetical protein A2462_00320 [candidate division WOR-1 bacterium RIFOXYC2_FULL_41_25]OGC42322.1 MAG: hypothetical protein A2548_08200 [candidate division WOR-1 bacterium RIFOXYD2_FULL_41_8]